MAQPTATVELLPHDHTVVWAPSNPHALPWMYRIINPNGQELIGLTSGTHEEAEQRLLSVAKKCADFYHCQLTFNKTISQAANQRRKKRGRKVSTKLTLDRLFVREGLS